MQTKWTRVFLSLGNGEVQRLLPAHQRRELNNYLRFAFRSLALLADEIVQPIAHFYVEETRKVTLTHLPLFQRHVAKYIIGPDVDSAIADIRRKSIEYPERRSDFGNEEYIRQMEIDLRKVYLERRSEGRVGEACANQWVDLFKKRHCSELDDVGARLFTGSDLHLELDDEKLRAVLRSLPEERGDRAFTWAYVVKSLQVRNIRLSPGTLAELELALLSCYLRASSSTNRSILPGEGFFLPVGLTRGKEIHPLDLALFWRFAEYSGFLEALLEVSLEEVLEIRKDVSLLGAFREKYFTVVGEASLTFSECLCALRDSLRNEQYEQREVIRRFFRSRKTLLIAAMSDLSLESSIRRFLKPKSAGQSLIKSLIVEPEELPLIALGDELVARYKESLEKEMMDRKKPINSGPSPKGFGPAQTMGNAVLAMDIEQTSAPRPDVLLVTVNEIETRAVHDGFQIETGQRAIPVPLDGRVYHNLGMLNSASVYHALSEMGSGSVGAMQQTVDKAIRALDPAAVIAVGVAFGINEKKQAIGDILLSKQLRLYDLQRMGSKIMFRGDKPHATPRLINHFEGFAQTAWQGAKVRPGLLLTGDKLIDDIDYRNELLSIEGEAVGGEMEGAGLYVSSCENKVDWIVIKAICDWADGKKRKNKKTRQKTAASNAVQFLIQALKYAPLKRQK